MKNTILVAAATAFVTTVMVLFIVAMAKGPGCKSHCGGHQMQMHHGGMSHGGMKCGKGGHGGHGMHKSKCGKGGSKKCGGTCKSEMIGDEDIQIEKKVIIKKEEE